MTDRLRTKYCYIVLTKLKSNTLFKSGRYKPPHRKWSVKCGEIIPIGGFKKHLFEYYGVPRGSRIGYSIENRYSNWLDIQHIERKRKLQRIEQKWNVY